ncbi:MAG: restriction endonuclease subunit S [Bacteroidetes bacterium]|nr:MAG: restriction endonuclease subunit S [Bacteroidota bacterium]
MMFPSIRCYHEGAVVPPHSFFILCKGCNAGKPGFQPWINSFIVVCPHEEYFNFYFWLIYGLWRDGKFKTRHRGSVIPFINLNDVRDLIREVAPAIQPGWNKYQQILETLNKLEQKKTSLAEQIIITANLQRHLLRTYFDKLK